MEKDQVRDMSKHCGLKYEDYWMAANHYRTMSQDEWEKWFNENCDRCQYMCDICMYGEA